MTLSNAERQRRYIARLKEKASATNGNVTNEAVSNEFMRLKAFADQLERENATIKKTLATVTNEVARLKAENKALKGKLATAERHSDLLNSAMTAAQFNAILKCLHPDTVYRLNDEWVTKQFNEAFKTVNGLRSQLVK